MSKQSEFLEQVGDALDSLTDGRGLGPDGVHVLNVCNAAPDMLRALKLSLEVLRVVKFGNNAVKVLTIMTVEDAIKKAEKL